MKLNVSVGSAEGAVDIPFKANKAGLKTVDKSSVPEDLPLIGKGMFARVFFAKVDGQQVAVKLGILVREPPALLCPAHVCICHHGLHTSLWSLFPCFPFLLSLHAYTTARTQKSMVCVFGEAPPAGFLVLCWLGPKDLHRRLLVSVAGEGPLRYVPECARKPYTKVPGVSFPGHMVCLSPGFLPSLSRASWFVFPPIPEPGLPATGRGVGRRGGCLRGGRGR